VYREWRGRPAGERSSVQREILNCPHKMCHRDGGSIVAMALAIDVV
jgi:hypothetical protein